MDNFPSIATPSDIKEQAYKAQLRTEFESGTTQTRAKTTRGREKYQVEWERLSEADYQTLKAFFYSHIGLSFIWTHPIELVTHTVIFSEDTLESLYAGPGYRSLSLPLEED
ncbi:MAG: hypothetical protein ABIL58_12820 [Pseudomonadota bacterium]